MLLNDIGRVPANIFKKINQHLETNYGFKISEDVKDQDLLDIMEAIEDEIAELKIKGDVSKTSPEISKRMLVLEGIKNLREFVMAQELQSPDLEKVINGLTDYVCDTFTISGTTQNDFEECVRDAMKHYRSSRYRFPDDLIENKVRELSMSRLHNPVEPNCLDTLGSVDTLENSPILGEAGSEDDQGEESEFMPVNNFDEELELEPFGSVSKRTSALGGHAATLPTTSAGKRTLSKLDNPSLSLAPDYKEPEGEESIGGEPKYVVDKTGRKVLNPFYRQKLELMKGKTMKESLVKNLRRLLETEVSQAEVMMAAKGFAQELQEMIEKIGRLQNEDLPPVTDQMRETYGIDSSAAFQTQIYGALQGVMDALYTAKGQVDDAVSNMAETGHVGAEIDMDKEIQPMAGDEGMPVGDEFGDEELDLDNIAADLGGDEFGGAEEEEPLGRSKKVESVQNLERKVLEMRKLVAKARALKESKSRS